MSGLHSTAVEDTAQTQSILGLHKVLPGSASPTTFPVHSGCSGRWGQILDKETKTQTSSDQQLAAFVKIANAMKKNFFGIRLK